MSGGPKRFIPQSQPDSCEHTQKKAGAHRGDSSVFDPILRELESKTGRISQHQLNHKTGRGIRPILTLGDVKRFHQELSTYLIRKGISLAEIKRIQTSRPDRRTNLASIVRAVWEQCDGTKPEHETILNDSLHMQFNEIRAYFEFEHGFIWSE